MNETKFIIICCCAMLLSSGILLYFLQQQDDTFWNEKRQETIKQNIIIVQNFKTLTDCTEMTLQLSELRFYNDTFKQHVWDHYRDLC